MQNNKLHQWLIVLVIVSLFSTSCSKKNYVAKQEEKEDEAEIYENRNLNNRPPEVLYINDENAKTNRNGEIFYEDENGFRYWKFCDGKYYLDSKYEQNGYTPEKKNKKTNKKVKKNKQLVEE